jgi:hypothetical protein
MVRQTPALGAGCGLCGVVVARATTSLSAGTDTDVGVGYNLPEYETFDLWSELFVGCLLRVGAGFCWVGGW